MDVVPEVPNCDAILAGLKEQLPVSILDSLDLRGKKVGLVIIDEVNGFCTPGAGNLAPVAQDAVIDTMISRTNLLAKYFAESGRPILIFRDTHNPEKPEPPYPPHCIKGTGEEELVEPLQWLLDPNTATSPITVINKDCIDGYIGGLTAVSDQVKDWIEFEDVEVMLVMGICTDICDLQFVQTVLSARNHGRLGNLQDVAVYVRACATYDLPLEVASAIGLPNTAAHPRDLAQHIGLYLMQASGAILTNSVISD